MGQAAGAGGGGGGSRLEAVAVITRRHVATCKCSVINAHTLQSPRFAHGAQPPSKPAPARAIGALSEKSSRRRYMLRNCAAVCVLIGRACASGSRAAAAARVSHTAGAAAHHCRSCLRLGVRCTGGCRLMGVGAAPQARAAGLRAWMPPASSQGQGNSPLLLTCGLTSAQQTPSNRMERCSAAQAARRWAPGQGGPLRSACRAGEPCCSPMPALHWRCAQSGRCTSRSGWCASRANAASANGAAIIHLSSLAGAGWEGAGAGAGGGVGGEGGQASAAGCQRCRSRRAPSPRRRLTGRSAGGRRAQTQTPACSPAAAGARPPPGAASPVEVQVEGERKLVDEEQARLVPHLHPAGECRAHWRGRAVRRGRGGHRQQPAAAGGGNEARGKPRMHPRPSGTPAAARA